MVVLVGNNSPSVVPIVNSLGTVSSPLSAHFKGMAEAFRITIDY